MILLLKQLFVISQIPLHLKGLDLNSQSPLPLRSLLGLEANENPQNNRLFEKRITTKDTWISSENLRDENAC